MLNVGMFNFNNNANKSEYVELVIADMLRIRVVVAAASRAQPVPAMSVDSSSCKSSSVYQGRKVQRFVHCDFLMKQECLLLIPKILQEGRHQKMNNS